MCAKFDPEGGEARCFLNDSNKLQGCTLLSTGCW